MAEIRKLQVNDTEVYPVTHEKAVYGSDGKTINQKYISSVVFGEDVDLPEVDATEIINNITERLDVIEDELEEIKEHVENNTAIADKTGNLTDLRTDHKEDIVSAVNELKSDVDDLQESISNKVDTSTYNAKVSELETSINQAFQSGNNVKQQLVDALIAKDINVSTNNKFNELITELENFSNSSEGVDLPGWITRRWCKAYLPLNEALHVCAFASAVVGKKIYVFCGYNTLNSVYLDQALCIDTESEIYNATTVKKNLGSLMADCRAGTINDKIYIVGGSYYSSDSYYYNTNYCYDPSIDTYTTKRSMPIALADTGVTVLNNRLYVTGGASSTYNVNTNYCYDPSSDSWSTKRAMPIYIGYHSAATIGSNIYILGGYSSTTKYDNGTCFNTNYCYNPSSNTYSTKKEIPIPVIGCGTCTYNNKIYLSGGDVLYDSNEYYWGYNKFTYVYNPSTNEWNKHSMIDIKKNAFSYHSMHVIDDVMYTVMGQYYNYEQNQYMDCPVLNAYIFNAENEDEGYISDLSFELGAGYYDLSFPYEWIDIHFNLSTKTRFSLQDLYDTYGDKIRVTLTGDMTSMYMSGDVAVLYYISSRSTISSIESAGAYVLYSEDDVFTEFASSYDAVSYVMDLMAFVGDDYYGLSNMFITFSYACNENYYLNPNNYTLTVESAGSSSGGNSGGGTTVEGLAIMKDNYYQTNDAFKTSSNYVTHSTSSGLFMKSSYATYHVYAALQYPYDLSKYNTVKLTFKAGVAGTFKFMIGASVTSKSSGSASTVPTFNAGTSEVKTATAYGTQSWNVYYIDISNLTGTNYLTLVAVYDSDTVYYNQYGLYITDFELQ